MKNLLAIVLGVGALGFGIWRLTQGETTGGLVVTFVGLFLIVRGVTGTVRRGL